MNQYPQTLTTSQLPYSPSTLGDQSWNLQQPPAQQTLPPPEQKPSLVSKIITIALEAIIVALVLFYLAKLFVFQQFAVVGKSMLPTIHDGEVLLVNTWAYKWSTPKRGDIVVLIPPEHTEDHYVKRVVGLPGETLEIKGDGQVLVYNTAYPNGIHLNESYLPESLETMGALREKLLEDEYFVMGDNRMESSDSRGIINNLKTTWHLPKQNIVGKAVVLMEKDKWLFSLGPFSIPEFILLSDPTYNL